MLLAPLIVVASIATIASLVNLLGSRFTRIFDAEKFDGTPPKIEVIINGAEFTVESTIDSLTTIYTFAIDYCSTHGSQLGFNVSTFKQCCQPIVHAMVQYQYKYEKLTYLETTPRIPLYITLSSNATDNSSDEKDPLSSSSDKRDDEAPYIPGHQEIINESLDSSTTTTSTTTPMERTGTMMNAIESQDVQLQRLPLSINGITYYFEYLPPSDTADAETVATQLAEVFCAEHGAQLIFGDNTPREGGAGDENATTTTSATADDDRRATIRQECVLPIQQSIVANLAVPLLS